MADKLDKEACAAAVAEIAKAEIHESFGSTIVAAEDGSCTVQALCEALAKC